MESYVVRIYRRRLKGRHGLIVGIVEEVGRADRRAFNDRDELWRILTAPGTRPGRHHRDADGDPASGDG